MKLTTNQKPDSEKVCHWLEVRQQPSAAWLGQIEILVVLSWK